MFFFKPFIIYSLLASLAFFLAMLTWSLFFNGKAGLADYLLAHKLPEFTERKTVNSWYWLDQSVRVSDESTVVKARDFNPVSLGIRLLGIVRAEGRGVAIFAVRTKMKVVGLGELITADVKLTQIKHDFVILTHEDQDAVLSLDQKKEKNLFRFHTLKSNQSSIQLTENQFHEHDAAAQLPNQSKRKHMKLKQLRQILKQEPMTARHVASFRQVFKQGKIEGVEVKPKSDPDLFEALGLQSEDIVLSVNDLSIQQLINTPGDWSDLLNADSINFHIRRNGVILNYQFVW